VGFSCRRRKLGGKYIDNLIILQSKIFVRQCRSVRMICTSTWLSAGQVRPFRVSAPMHVLLARALDFGSPLYNGKGNGLYEVGNWTPLRLRGISTSGQVLVGKTRKEVRTSFQPHLPPLSWNS